jgi:hypothetical protein
MEPTNEQPGLFNHVIKWGLIVAGVSITMTILLYVLDYTLMVQLKTLFALLLVYFGITVYGGIDYRKSIGGFLPYGKAFIHGFGVLAVSGLVATIFSFILYNVIDTELPQKLTDASLENTRQMLEGFGTPEDAIDKAMEEGRKSTERQFTPVGQLIGFATILFFSALMALISALFVRKNEPIDA